MATFNVEIALSGAAFEDSSEVARILRALADKVEVQVISGYSAEEESLVHNGSSGLTAGSWSAKDVNGNSVASAWIEED